MKQRSRNITSTRLTNLVCTDGDTIAKAKGDYYFAEIAKD